MSCGNAYFGAATEMCSSAAGTDPFWLLTDIGTSSYRLLARSAQPAWGTSRRHPRRGEAGLSARIQSPPMPARHPWFGGLPPPTPRPIPHDGNHVAYGVAECLGAQTQGRGPSGRRCLMSMSETESLAALRLSAPSQDDARCRSVAASNERTEPLSANMFQLNSDLKKPKSTCATGLSSRTKSYALHRPSMVEDQ